MKKATAKKKKKKASARAGTKAISLRWLFPENPLGQEQGFNDAGIETFRGDSINHLARETIQNSLDALSLIHISEPTRPY